MIENIKTIFKYGLVLICILLIVFKTQKKDVKPHQNLIIQEILDEYSDSLKIKRFGIGCLVKHNGKTESYAIGIAGDSIKMTPNKVFTIGSLTKTFTSVLIMQEVEKGTISLTDSLYLFFPKELVKNDNIDLNITIEQLLRHRSGLGEVIVDTIANRCIANPYDEYNHSFLFTKIPKPLNKPNEKFKYTNTNYILLGYILENINNKSYEDILYERIFKPTKMNNSHGYYSPAIENSAHPMFEGEDFKDYMFYKYYKNYGFSAGSIASTLNDLKLFFENLYEQETLLKKETFNKMIDSETSYGLGIQIFHKGENNTIYLGHAGDDFSFKLRNYYNPENGDLIIVFSNHYDDPFTYKIAKRIIDTLEAK